jgi:hypothetical protein
MKYITENWKHTYVYVHYLYTALYVYFEEKKNPT